MFGREGSFLRRGEAVAWVACGGSAARSACRFLPPESHCRHARRRDFDGSLNCDGAREHVGSGKYNSFNILAADSPCGKWLAKICIKVRAVKFQQPTGGFWRKAKRGSGWWDQPDVACPVGIPAGGYLNATFTGNHRKSFHPRARSGKSCDFGKSNLFHGEERAGQDKSSHTIRLLQFELRQVSQGWMVWPGNLESLFAVQGTRLAILPHAAKIVQTISDIRIFLSFKESQAWAKRVNRPRRYKYCLPGVR